jgi:peptidoglycan/LPS O-acetylase OafA/YrhL
LRQFYWRRALRLLPALVLYLLTMAVFARVSQAGTAPSASDFAGALFYVSNYTTAMQGADNVLVHTWSLAVEEQFYIVWPVVMIAVLTLTRGLRVLTGVAVAGTLAAIALRILLWDDGAGADRIYYGTDTHMDGLLVGCLGAIWLRRGATGRNHPALAAGCLVATAALGLGNDVVQYLLVPTLVPLLVIVAILALVQQPQEQLLTNPVLRWVGRRSYAIYLWHFPLFGAAASVPGPSTWPALVVALALTLAIAHLSWRCVEEPFLALKSRGILNPKISTTKSVEGLATSSPSI